MFEAPKPHASHNLKPVISLRLPAGTGQADLILITRAELFIFLLDEAGQVETDDASMRPNQSALR